MGSKRGQVNEGCGYCNFFRAGMWYTAGMNEAWRGICQPGTILINIVCIAIQTCYNVDNEIVYCFVINTGGAFRLYY
jgi:hypothetical protein